MGVRECEIAAEVLVVFPAVIAAQKCRYRNGEGYEAPARGAINVCAQFNEKYGHCQLLKAKVIANEKIAKRKNTI